MGRNAYAFGYLLGECGETDLRRVGRISAVLDYHIRDSGERYVDVIGTDGRTYLSKMRDVLIVDES